MRNYAKFLCQIHCLLLDMDLDQLTLQKIAFLSLSLSLSYHCLTFSKLQCDFQKYIFFSKSVICSWIDCDFQIYVFFSESIICSWTVGNVGK